MKKVICKVLTVMGKKSEKGQSLLELTIALGIATIIISALTITTLVSLRNSQFAQNQLQATKFAQDGLELVKTARSKNCAVSANFSTYYWYNNPSFWSYAVSNPTPTTQYLKVNTNNDPCITVTNSPNPDKLNNLSRIITVTDSAGVTNSKIITATVTWEDASGSHESKITTVLTEH